MRRELGGFETPLIAHRLRSLLLASGSGLANGSAPEPAILEDSGLSVFGSHVVLSTCSNIH